jgi:hypothetical protein
LTPRGGADSQRAVLTRGALFLAMSLVAALPAVAGETELGAVLPDGARKVAEHRYKSSTDFEGTMKFYKNIYPAQQYPRKAIVNQPGVKAIHIPNTSGRGSWEGLNIYEANEEVRIYVVPTDGSGKRRKK